MWALHLVGCFLDAGTDLVTSSHCCHFRNESSDDRLSLPLTLPNCSSASDNWMLKFYYHIFYLYMHMLQNQVFSWLIFKLFFRVKTHCLFSQDDFVSYIFTNLSVLTYSQVFRTFSIKHHIVCKEEQSPSSFLTVCLSFLAQFFCLRLAVLCWTELLRVNLSTIFPVQGRKDFNSSLLTAIIAISHLQSSLG